MRAGNARSKAAAQLPAGSDRRPTPAELTGEQRIRRERTLLLAIVLSAFGPFVTGYAVIVSDSTTQMADFVRRTIELAAMIVSWAVFRFLARSAGAGAVAGDRWYALRRLADGSVAGAMGASSLTIAILALSRVGAYTAGGNVYPGLTIALLGLGVNSAFQLRYAAMTRERYDSIIAAQRRLYLGKSAVDLCIVLALGAVAVAPAHPATAAIDLFGSLCVALYLAWSAVAAMRRRRPVSGVCRTSLRN